MATHFEQLLELIDAGIPCAAVTVVDVMGSVPNERGSKMIVTTDGLHSGTVGGGKIEKKAIDEAIAMISRGSAKSPTHFVSWSLQKDVGMTCGGSVKLYFEAFNVSVWNVVVFGAGHVSQALTPILLQLDCRVTCIDPRDEWLSRLPSSPKLRKVQSDDMPSEVAKLPDDAYVLLMTMGHTTDKPILIEILRSGRQFPYLGVIGSKAKAVRLRKDVAEAGLPDELQHAFRCPVGIQIGTNAPGEIAVSIAAQLIEQRDRNRAEIAVAPRNEELWSEGESTDRA
ncbi:MAG TPA: xanthine dehydrogenase accessory protein XdhC [Thermoanaerobaculia bacterium]|nr:xanthine dehydrogenase accessory protein XdhC [Thermoanaerobaculia bacterium]